MGAAGEHGRRAADPRRRRLAGIQPGGRGGAGLPPIEQPPRSPHRATRPVNAGVVRIDRHCGSTSPETEAAQAAANASHFSLNRAATGCRHRQQPRRLRARRPSHQYAGTGTPAAPADRLHRSPRSRAPTPTRRRTPAETRDDRGRRDRRVPHRRLQRLLPGDRRHRRRAPTRPRVPPTRSSCSARSPPARSAIGDSVRVTGNGQEFQGDDRDRRAADGDRSSPTPAAGRSSRRDPVTRPPNAQKEAHEGELIAPQGTFTVTDNYDANWYGASPSPPATRRCASPPTPDPPASAEAQAAVADNAARTVTLDDGASVNYTAPPTPAPRCRGSRRPTRSAIGSKVTLPPAGDPRVPLLAVELPADPPGHRRRRRGRDLQRHPHRQRSRRDRRRRPPAGDVQRRELLPDDRRRIRRQRASARCTYYNDRAGNHIAVNTLPARQRARAARPTTPASQRQQAKIVTGINRLGAEHRVAGRDRELREVRRAPRRRRSPRLVDALNAAAGATVWAYVALPGRPAAAGRPGRDPHAPSSTSRRTSRSSAPRRARPTSRARASRSRSPASRSPRASRRPAPPTPTRSWSSPTTGSPRAAARLRRPRTPRRRR